MDAATQIAKANQKAGEQISENLQKGFHAIHQQQSQIHGAILTQTNDMNRGIDNLNMTVETGFNTLHNEMYQVGNKVDAVGQTLVAVGEHLSEGLASLKASFDIGMTKVISQFELQRSELKDGFNKLADLLENSRKTEARERYLDGKAEYEKYQQFPDEPQFLTDALEYLKLSIEIYKGNPYAHFYLGHIYQEPAIYYDLKKSLEHYKLCATYGKGTQNDSITALGYFNASWVSYVLEDVDEAINLAELSKNFDDDLPENWYNLAKYHAYKKEPRKSLTYLDTAIKRFDPNYTVKANMDIDSTKNIKPALETYFLEIRDDEAKELDDKLKNFGIQL